VRRVRQLLSKRALRRKEHAVAVEGAELLVAALEAHLPVEAAFVAPGGRDDPAVARVLEHLYQQGGRVFDLAPGVIERVADTVTPQPLVAVVAFEPERLEVVEHARSVMVCVDVRDPGNLGTMIRTAESAGVGGIICCAGTVDPTNPKSLRASAGSMFRVPVVSAGDADEVLERLGELGFARVGTVARGGTDYATFDWRGRIALIFGNEASGLGDELSPLLDAWVSIPMAGRADSLNVSVSAAILCFETLRVRRLSGEPVPGSTMPAMGMPDDGRVHPQEGQR
jgi:RNA methyltransferase, TrmH family